MAQRLVVGGGRHPTVTEKQMVHVVFMEGLGNHPIIRIEEERGEGLHVVISGAGGHRQPGILQRVEGVGVQVPRRIEGIDGPVFLREPLHQPRFGRDSAGERGEHFGEILKGLLVLQEITDKQRVIGFCGHARRKEMVDLRQRIGIERVEDAAHAGQVVAAHVAVPHSQRQHEHVGEVPGLRGRGRAAERPHAVEAPSAVAVDHAPAPAILVVGLAVLFDDVGNIERKNRADRPVGMRFDNRCYKAAARQRAFPGPRRACNHRRN